MDNKAKSCQICTFKGVKGSARPKELENMVSQRKLKLI